MGRASTALGLLLVCALMLLVAGCGVGDDQSPERTPAQIENENEPGENENEYGENENESGENENEPGENENEAGGNEVDENEPGEQENGVDEPSGPDEPSAPDAPHQGGCAENPGECEPGS